MDINTYNYPWKVTTIIYDMGDVSGSIMIF